MIIALLTDFGTEDYFVAAMKGVILSIEPEVRIVDITHQIEPQNISAAAFTLKNCYREFPAGTIFVCVVDPGVGSARRAVVVKNEKYHFIAPDNGLLGFVVESAQSFSAFELTNAKYFRHPVSRTFHGRDIFAPAAAWLARGVSAADFGPQITDLIHEKFKQPDRDGAGRVTGQIIHIDRFGNLITNLTAEALGEAFVVEHRDKIITRHLSHYAEAQPNELFTIFGSAGYLEIVAFRNSAQRILDAATGDKIMVKT